MRPDGQEQPLQEMERRRELAAPHFALIVVTKAIFIYSRSIFSTEYPLKYGEKMRERTLNLSLKGFEPGLAPRLKGFSSW
jgi:hypothetical protein